MKILTLANRNAKEILRDPLTLFFGLGFPLVLLLLLSAIQSAIPVSLFEIDHLTPGITVFGLSFMTLFSATIISRDRSSSLLRRLYTAPLSPADFILGYTLPMIPISLAQCVICYIAAFFIGLTPSVNVLYATLLIIPVSLLYIALGLLCGSALNDKQVGGICGALLSNISAWLSGVWFDLSLVGGVFEKLANLLPFVHAVELQRAVISGNLDGTFVHLAVVLAYAAAMTVLAVVAFLKQMKKQ